MTQWLLPALCGLVTGILSAWGIGGGTLLLLCMTLFFGVEQRTAQAINLLYFLPTAGVSLFAHRKNGYLDAAALRAAIPTGIVCALIHRVLLDTEREEVAEEKRRDYKTLLQEFVQRTPNQTLSYRQLGESGPDHDKTFCFEVLLNGGSVGKGAGRSKKEAEQMAAKDALEALDKR